MDFEFVGSLGNMYKQIGNAVPVLLAQKVAEGIKNELNEYDKKYKNKEARNEVAL